jgi:SAM-dependent methyltransferase/acyl carrier protein
MAANGSYNIDTFGSDAQREARRLNAQVDLFWQQELALFRRCGLVNGMRILDCGCGPGYLLEKFSLAFPEATCIGVEIADYLVDAARKNIEEKRLMNCTVHSGSILRLSFKENEFDFVVSRLVLEHLPEPLQALREVLRVLKPGGTAVFIDNDFDLHERTWPDSPALGDLYDAYRRARRVDGGNPCIGRELPGLLKSCGFADVDLQTICAHSEIVGDAVFLKAEGSGIPAQLVKDGFLKKEQFDAVAKQWADMLGTRTHAICRVLFAGIGKKPASGNSSPGPEEKIMASVENTIDENTAVTHEGLVNWMRCLLADELGVDQASIDPSVSMIKLGIDSLVAVTLTDELKKKYKVELPIHVVLSDTTMGSIAEMVIRGYHGNTPGNNSGKGMEKSEIWEEGTV